GLETFTLPGNSELWKASGLSIASGLSVKIGGTPEALPKSVTSMTSLPNEDSGSRPSAVKKSVPSPAVQAPSMLLLSTTSVAFHFTRQPLGSDAPSPA